MTDVFLTFELRRRSEVCAPTYEIRNISITGWDKKKSLVYEGLRRLCVLCTEPRIRELFIDERISDGLCEGPRADNVASTKPIF